eukprot:6014424-Prymnesium_polylepis.1
MDDGMVTLVHGEQEWPVRASTLRNCSAVLDAMLRDSDSKQPRTINMDDVFSDKPLTSHAMPLVHKYDCKAPGGMTGGQG